MDPHEGAEKIEMLEALISSKLRKVSVSWTYSGGLSFSVFVLVFSWEVGSWVHLACVISVNHAWSSVGSSRGGVWTGASAIVESVLLIYGLLVSWEGQYSLLIMSLRASPQLDPTRLTTRYESQSCRFEKLVRACACVHKVLEGERDWEQTVAWPCPLASAFLFSPSLSFSVSLVSHSKCMCLLANSKVLALEFLGL